MIVTRDEMIRMEQGSGLPVGELMERAGRAVYGEIRRRLLPGERVLVLCGKGNNGGDGFVIARLLYPEVPVRVWLLQGEPQTGAAREAYEKLPEGTVLNAAGESAEEDAFAAALAEADAVVDAFCGFSFRGGLREPQRSLFRRVNESGKRVFSVDLNSGSEADTGFFDPDALRSECTFALGSRKPVHAMNRQTCLAAEIHELGLGLPRPEKPVFTELTEELLFSRFPKKGPGAWKGSFGTTLLIAGSCGMPGAACLNVLGAKTLGAPYIHCALPESIYPIAAGRFLTPVWHPFTEENALKTVREALHSASAAAFGSGAVRMPGKEAILRLLLEETDVPAVLDAEALDLFASYEAERTGGAGLPEIPERPARLILTPHRGEFRRLLLAEHGREEAEELLKRPLSAAADYAARHGVVVILKGPATVCAAPDGRRYINETGNQALAQAGSGDVLAGMAAAMLSFVKDPFFAACAAVFLHGLIADRGLLRFARQTFPLEAFPEIMDGIFREHGF